jgi:hypothetical protein
VFGRCWRTVRVGELRHRHIEHAQVGLLAQGHLDGLGAIAGLRDNRHSGLALKQQADATADDAMVVSDQDAQVAQSSSFVGADDRVGERGGTVAAPIRG